MRDISALTTFIGFACLLIAAAYNDLALIAVLVWQCRGRPNGAQRLPPVSVLKPLYGAEPSLYENLRSFCQQRFPEYQLVFGVLDRCDPALSVVERLRTEFPSLPIEVVINPKQHGSNRKVSNLINMIARSRHDVLAMSDSDVCVGPDYLSIVTAPLRDSAVGLVTSLYHAVPTRSVFSRLGAMYINEWYIPSVLIAWLFGYQGYVSGQTLCVRRDTLEAIGGLHAITNHLADDHQLGEQVRELGLRVVISPCVPIVECHEPNFASLTRHEARWMLTLRVLRPRSFPFVFLSFGLPLALVGIVLAVGAHTLAPLAWTLFGIAVAARLALHFSHRFGIGRRVLSDLWLMFGRDLLLCVIWFWSLFTSRITWRGNEFDVDSRGIMHRLP
ncbi:MAG: bacteriohopanetetrol glucosamine biosynthesis glycosyltransferase HpnI [Steroidobacteraceae bacterium]